MTTLRHTGIVVADLDRALTFWHDWLGFTVLSDVFEYGSSVEQLLKIPHVQVRVVKLSDMAGGVIELLQFQAGTTYIDCGDSLLIRRGLTHVAVTVPDLDGLLARWSSVWRGGDPVVSADGTTRALFCQDPDGTPVELVELKKPAWLNSPVDHSQQGQSPGDADRTQGPAASVRVAAAPSPPGGLDYLAYTYDQRRIPYTSYPWRLAEWVNTHVLHNRGGRLVDFGCGRGEYLKAFYDLGYTVLGLDQSPAAVDFSPTFPILFVDVEEDPPTYTLEPHDVAFSKSVIEHCRNPLAHLRQLKQVLKPGGIAVVLTPDWETQGWGPFYGDPTHVSPFTVPALHTALELAGFTQVWATQFTQLPVVWRHPALRSLVALTAALRLPYRPFHTAVWPEALNTWIRFSRERMVLGVGVA